MSKIVSDCSGCKVGNHTLHQSFTTRRNIHYDDVICRCTGDCADRLMSGIEKGTRDELAAKATVVKSAWHLLLELGFSVELPQQYSSVFCPDDNNQMWPVTNSFIACPTCGYHKNIV